MLTDTLAQSILNCIAGYRNYTTTFHSGSIYIGLSTTTPTYTGGDFTEPSSSTGYARVLVSTGTMSNGAVTASTHTVAYLGAPDYDSTNKYWYITNSTEIKFPEVAGDTWGTLTHFGLFTSTTSTEKPFFVGKLTSAIEVTSTSTSEGKIAIIRAGELIIKINTD